jgi:hypothetical protein
VLLRVVYLVGFVWPQVLAYVSAGGLCPEASVWVSHSVSAAYSLAQFHYSNAVTSLIAGGNVTVLADAHCPSQDAHPNLHLQVTKNLWDFFPHCCNVTAVFAAGACVRCLGQL